MSTAVNFEFHFVVKTDVALSALKLCAVLAQFRHVRRQISGAGKRVIAFVTAEEMFFLAMPIESIAFRKHFVAIVALEWRGGSCGSFVFAAMLRELVDNKISRSENVFAIFAFHQHLIGFGVIAKLVGSQGVFVEISRTQCALENFQTQAGVLVSFDSLRNIWFLCLRFLKPNVSL